MANNSQKLIDSTRRVVYKFTGDATEARTLKIDAGGLAYALNANGYIITGSDRKSNYGLTLKKVIHSISGGGYVEISTNGDTGNTIVNLGGSGTLAFDEGGGSVTINCASYANSTGNIFLTLTGGTGPVNTYTVLLDFRKLAYSYDQGQTADPRAFNV